MKIDKGLIESFAKELHSQIRAKVLWENVPTPVQAEFKTYIAYHYYNFGKLDVSEVKGMEKIIYDFIKGKCLWDYKQVDQYQYKTSQQNLIAT